MRPLPMNRDWNKSTIDALTMTIDAIKLVEEHQAQTENLIRDLTDLGLAWADIRNKHAEDELTNLLGRKVVDILDSIGDAWHNVKRSNIVETSVNPMHCPQCNAVMTETIEDYSFYHRTNDSDTHRSITLSNMRINRCRCGETTVTIPKIEELHGFLDSNPNATLLTYGPTTWH
jgi:hypothetical protein